MNSLLRRVEKIETRLGFDPARWCAQGDHNFAELSDEELQSVMTYCDDFLAARCGPEVAKEVDVFLKTANDATLASISAGQSCPEWDALLAKTNQREEAIND